MELENYIALHKNDSVAKKIHQLVLTMDIIGTCRVQIIEARHNLNTDDEKHWDSERKAQEDRLDWLLEELSSAVDKRELCDKIRDKMSESLDPTQKEMTYASRETFLGRWVELWWWLDHYCEAEPPKWEDDGHSDGVWEERVLDKSDEPCGFLRRRFYCSACGDWQTYGKTRYCPSCGMRMKVGKEEAVDAWNTRVKSEYQD